MFWGNASKSLGVGMKSATIAGWTSGKSLQSLLAEFEKRVGIAVASQITDFQKDEIVPSEFLRTIRPLATSISTWAVLVLVGLMTWGYARSGQAPRPSTTAKGPAAERSPESRPSLTATQSDEDARQIPTTAEKPSAGRLIEALRQQVGQSPLLQDADAQSSLLDSLDRAGEIWTKTQRQNREALRELKRQVRIGESRQAPHLVLITFERASALDATESPRKKLFADLAKRGVTFSQHYAGGESPVSGWWTLMVGRNTGRARADETRFQRRDSEPTLATALWQAGYATGFFGMWSDRLSPLDNGFDDWSGLRDANDPAALYPTTLSTARSKMTISANGNGQSAVSLWKLLDAEIASFITSRTAQTRPMFLQIRLPELQPETTTPTDSAEGVVHHLFERLRKAGIESQTCVVVTALSGGDATATTPLSEDNLRVPFVMVGTPGLNPGTTITAPSTSCDLLPTFLELARATQKPTGTDGHSLVPGGKVDHAKADRLLYWVADQPGGAQAVRKGDWKGVAEKGARHLQLYHLPSDPQQEKNVATDHPDVVQQLLAPSPPAAAKDPKSNGYGRT